MKLLFVLIWVFSFCEALKLQRRQKTLNVGNFKKPDRIAIIGAGAGGSSAAYYLQRFANNSFDVTIFERSKSVGGRTATVPLKNSSKHQAEVGASIFVSANKILSLAVENFDLETQEYGDNAKKDSVGIDNSVGIWDGARLVFRFSGSFFDKIHFLLRYKLNALKAWYYTKKIVDLFLRYYYDEYFPFENLNTIGSATRFYHNTNILGIEYWRAKGVSDLFSSQIIQGLTRANYAQNLKSIHGLGSMVSIAANGAKQVKGGNWKIFHKFIESSKATLKLEQQVTYLEKDQKNKKWIIERLDLRSGKSYRDLFDKVVIATPIEKSDIKISGEDLSHINPTDYVHLHVTLFASNKKLDALYFGGKKGEAVPLTVLTSPVNNYCAADDNNSTLPFYSISMIDYLQDSGDYIYKVFSGNKIADGFLLNILERDSKINWIFRKEWDSYPKLYPTNNFKNFSIGENIWYLNGMESFISTMETSALAGANVAALISQGRNSSVLKIP